MARRAIVTAVLAAAFGLVLAQPATTAPATNGAYCTSSKALCIPDGRATWVVYGGTDCNWTATVTWGDGTKRIFHYDGGQHALHHAYKKRAFYKVTGVVKGKPDPGKNVMCGGGKASEVFEFPFTAAQRATLRSVDTLAERTKKTNNRLQKTYKEIKKQGGAKAPKPLLQKATKTERTLLDDLAKQAKKLAQDWATQKLQDEFTKKYSAAVGVGEESLKKLWGFLGKLGDLNQFPKSAVKAADKLYETDGDFRGYMNALASLAGCADDVYSKCTPAQKRYMDVEFTVIIRTGAVKQLINDAADAGIAGATVNFHVP
jgi:hypothetical protein